MPLNPQLGLALAFCWRCQNLKRRLTPGMVALAFWFALKIMMKLSHFRLKEASPSTDTRSYLAEEIATGKPVMVHLIPSEEPARSRITELINQLMSQWAIRGESPQLLFPENEEFLVSPLIPGFTGLKQWLESQLDPGFAPSSRLAAMENHPVATMQEQDELLSMMQSYMSKKEPSTARVPKELTQTRIGLKGFDPPDVTASTFGKNFTTAPPPAPPPPSGPSFEMVISGVRKMPETARRPIDPPLASTSGQSVDSTYKQLQTWKRVAMALAALVAGLALALAFLAGRALR